MAVAGESALHPDRGDSGANLQFRTVDHKEQQGPAVAEAIVEMRRHGYRYADQAVLCTGNEALADLGRELEQLGVPVLYLGSLFERPEIRDNRPKLRGTSTTYRMYLSDRGASIVCGARR